MSNSAFEVRSGLLVNNNILEVNALSGQVGINTAANNYTLTINATDGIYIPSGNTGQRPAQGNGGILRINTDTNAPEWATPISWNKVTVPLNAGRLICNDGWIANSSTANGVYGNTQVVFTPYNGNGVRINGAVYELPAGGISANANNAFLNGVASGLAPNQVYYVYAFNNNGTLSLDFSLTGHTTSSTPGNVGTEIKQGDDTRSLVGMVYAINNPGYANTYFAYNNEVGNTGGRRSVCYTLSWFNRRWQWLNWNASFSTNQPGGWWYPWATLWTLMWGDEPSYNSFTNGFPYMAGTGSGGSQYGQVGVLIAVNSPSPYNGTGAGDVSGAGYVITWPQSIVAGVGYDMIGSAYAGTTNAIEGLNRFDFMVQIVFYQFQLWLNAGVSFRG